MVRRIQGLSERELYEQNFENVYKTAYFILKDKELAEDATQETFVKAFKNLHNLQDITKIGAWLKVIASRTAIDIYNKKKKRNETISEDFLMYKEHSYEEKEEESVQEIEEKLEILKPEFKEILILKYIEGLKENEIADLLKIKLGTVKSRISRAKEALIGKGKTGGEEDVE